MDGHDQFNKVSASVGQGPNNLKAHTFYKCTTCGRVMEDKRKANAHKKYFADERKWRKDHYGR